MKLTNHKAFTLIELLIVLLLIGLTAVLSLQGLHVLKQHADDEILSSKLSKILQFAKQESLLRHADIAICFANKENECQMSASESIVAVTEYNQKIATMNLRLSGGQLYWRAYPFYRDRILFYSSGDKLNDNATYWFCHRGDRSPVWAITMGRDGRIRKVLPDYHGVIKDSHSKLLACNADRVMVN